MIFVMKTYIRKAFYIIAIAVVGCSCNGKGKNEATDTSDSVKLSKEINVVIDSTATTVMAETIDFVDVPKAVEDSVMALLDEYYNVLRVDSVFTPETELEKKLYAMKDSITDEDYFDAHFDPHYDVKKGVFTISLNDPLPESFYVPTFAHILFGRNEGTSEVIGYYIGKLLLEQPQRIYEFITLASEMRDACKYSVLKDIIMDYLFEYFCTLKDTNNVSIPETPLYKYIKDDIVLNAYFIHTANEFKKTGV